ncbi:MAG: hypothetical protein MSG64_02985 [Pyrinomonadaceae bacterium MAG19_C2-C3]|nr:hypothetical protein [Pyrinomonadaceae bacterium MAG19_C2-C3]
MNILEEVFYQDGSLRDIYVCGTTSEDWQKLLAFLQTAKYQVMYRLDDVETSLPDDFDQIQKHMGNLGQLMSVHVDGVVLNCHFFWVEDIEFDISPNEVDTENKAVSVFEFMTQVGRVLQKEVVLTPENMQEHVHARYNLKTDKIELVST